MVAIKDFEMPKSCDDCDFFMGDNTHCFLGCFIPWRFDTENNKSKNCPLVEAIPKSDYEARLKADMIAMLTEIQLEIEEMPMHYDPRDVSDLIQQKIDKIKGEKEMSVMKYVKKPVEIEALQIFGNPTEIKKFIGDNGDAYIDDAAYEVGVHPPVTVVIIHTLEGDMRATDGDYIIKGIKGEFYPCRKDIFEETYEEIDKLKENKDAI